MSDVKFKARITEKGSISFYPADRVRFKQHLLNLKGKDVSFVVKQYRAGRSDNQNRYYWGVVIEHIAMNCGYNQQWEKEELHNVLKDKFLPKHGKMKIATSTAQLDTASFENYLSQIRQWASGFLGLYIPEPNEAGY